MVISMYIGVSLGTNLVREDHLMQAAVLRQTDLTPRQPEEAEISFDPKWNLFTHCLYVAV